MDEVHQAAAWTVALNLPEYRVTHVVEDGIDGVLRLNVVPKNIIGVCPECSRPSSTIHERRWIEDVLDLPLGGRPVRLKVRIYRFECEVCGRTWTPPSSTVAPGAWATNRLVERAAELVRRSDVANAAVFFGIPEKTLERWYYEYVERQQAAVTAAAHPIRSLGIDELSLKKKYRQFVAVITDHTNHRVLEVLESREKAQIKAYLEAGRLSGLFASVEEVTTDMWDGYVEAVKEAFRGQVRVTIDRFHVMQNFQDRLTEARREIQRTLPPGEAEALKGSRWLWLTNEENLTPSERRELDVLCRRFPRLGQLREQRESLRQIFEDHRIRTAERGTRRLQEWITEARELGLTALNKFCQTLENWLDKIANYFITRSSNGPTEGFNHGLRAILWRAFGMTNFQHFRARVLHAFGIPKTQ